MNEALKDYFKETLKTRGIAWSSAHRKAFEDLVEILDDKAIGIRETELINEKNRISNEWQKIGQTKIDIEKAAKNFTAQIEASDTILEFDDDVSKKAYRFAWRMAQLYKSLPEGIVTPLSYTVYAFLTGKENKHFESEEQGI